MDVNNYLHITHNINLAEQQVVKIINKIYVLDVLIHSKNSQENVLLDFVPNIIKMNHVENVNKVTN